MIYRYRVQTVCLPVVHETWTIASPIPLSREDLTRLVQPGTERPAGITLEEDETLSHVDDAATVIVVSIEDLRRPAAERGH